MSINITELRASVAEAWRLCSIELERLNAAQEVANLACRAAEDQAAKVRARREAVAILEAEWMDAVTAAMMAAQAEQSKGGER